MGPEAKLYKKIKSAWPQFSFNRLENSSLLGTPDLLVCNNSGHFFTIELKVAQGKKLKFSPHQISFHVRHPHNTFIIAEALGPGTAKLIYMYPGTQIMELDACGLTLEPLCLGLDACRLRLDALGA